MDRQPKLDAVGVKPSNISSSVLLSNNTLEDASHVSTTMPVSVYSEQLNTDSEDSAYDFEDCASESDSLLGHNKLKTPASSQTLTNGGPLPRSAQNFQLKMLDENLSCVGINQVSPTSESVVTEQFEDARSLQSPGSFFSTSPPESGASPARFHPVVECGAPISRCVALYNFSAENPDELDMVNHEELELLGEGEDEGWVRVRNYKGDEGFVPKSYLELMLGKDREREFSPRHSWDNPCSSQLRHSPQWTTSPARTTTTFRASPRVSPSTSGSPARVSRGGTRSSTARRSMISVVRPAPSSPSGRATSSAW